MELLFGNKVSAPDGYKKRNSFHYFDVWTKFLNNGREHYFDVINDDTLYMVFGDVYKIRGENPAEICRNAYIDGGLDKVFDVDGDFIFVKLSKSEITVLQANYGGPNLYYKIAGTMVAFSTDASVLMDDFSEADIDERSVCDYLLFGSMIGGNTFSKNIKALLRGQALSVKDGNVRVNNQRVIRFDSEYNGLNEDEVINTLTEKYLNAVEKRARGKVKESAMFLSGGKDSRLLLSALSKLFDDKITCISFGQFGADETQNAAITASINDNPFVLVNLSPDEHVKNAERYIKESIGMDWFPQSYVLSVLDRVEGFNNLFTGSNLSDICFHSKYMDEHIGSFMGSLSEYMRQFHSLARMTGFSREKLRWICGGKSEGLWESDHLDEDTRKYEGEPESIFVGYLNNTNGANQISFRTNVFAGKYLDVYDPSQDKEYMDAVSHLPLSMRLSDAIHIKMIQNINPDYLRPVYNDYKIPMQEYGMYEKAAVIEAQREKLFIQMMREWNPNHKDKFYYTHDYADFNGFIKYDDSWISYMDDMLLNRDAVIYRKYFVYERVEQMLCEHRNDVKNWKKELILLTSLEQFLRIYCRRK